MKYQLKNVILLGTSFHLIFLAYHNSVAIQQTVLNSLRSKSEDFLNINGYYVVCVTDIAFAIVNWLAAPVLKRTGLKYGMFLGSITYIPYSAMFLHPTTVLFYAIAALTGVGAAITWSAQGSFLSKNSTPGNTGQDAAIFWSIWQSSRLLGNLFIFFAFNDDKSEITDATRYLVFGSMTLVGTLGSFILLFLEDEESEDEEIKELSVFDALGLLKSPDILLLVFCFVFSGLIGSFPNGIWTTAIAATSQFGVDARKFIGLSGIFLGLGETIGGAIFGFGWGKSLARDTVVMLSFLVNFAAFVLIFLNIPANASLIDDRGYILPIINPSVCLAMISSFLMGFADACFNTQLYSLLMSAYTKQSIAAFGIFKFFQSMGSAGIYLYSTALNLHFHIGILAIMCTLATLNFFLVEWRFKSGKNQQALMVESS